MEYVDKSNQAPADQMMKPVQLSQQTGSSQSQTVQVNKARRKQNDAAALERFMARAGPVMEAVIEESEHLNQLDAAKRQAVELKQNLKFPEDILMLLCDPQDNRPAHVVNITAVHMFETMPQSKCAVAYELFSPRQDVGTINMIIVYSITSNQVLRILKCESEVRRMCTPADDQILIVGTAVGSLVLYDLQDFESNCVSQNIFDYESLLMQQNPADQEDTEMLNPQKMLKKLKTKYRLIGHIFSTDALPNNMHYSPITRLLFVSKHGSSPATIAAMDELGVVSSWSVIEIPPHIADKVGATDLNLNIGGKYKLLENF